MEEIDITGAFGTVKSEKRYISDRLDVQGARNKLFDANTKLTLARRAFDQTPTNSPAYQRAAESLKKAQAEVDRLKTEVSRAESVARSDYRKAYSARTRKETREKAATADRQIEVEQQVLQRLRDSGQNTAAQEAKIKDLIDKKNGTGKYAAKVEADRPVGQQQQTGTVRDYAQEILGAARTVKNLSPKRRRDLAEVLRKANFYKGPITSEYSDALVTAYRTALGQNQARSADWQEEVPWDAFISSKIVETQQLGAGVGGAQGPTGTVSISTPTEAAAKVEARFKAELGRMPTPEELKKYSDELIAEERKVSSITKATRRKVGGIEVTEYTGGLDRDTFLNNRIRKLPEYKESKAAARTLTTQSLARTALANGLDLSKNFGSDVVAGWVKRVENGEDVDIFKNLIRKTAAVGLPDNLAKLVDSGVDLDAIYAPYKRLMSNILQIPEAAIGIDDTTLRSAIGPEKPMTLFDFQRQLRKDPRWQFTDQAREEVSDAALRVLRDFGFMG